MANVASAFGTPSTFTLTLASLASNASQQSASLNATALSPIPLDILVSIKTRTAGTVASPFSLAVYAYGSADGGTTFSDGATGSNAAFTPTSPTNLKLLGIVNAPVTATTYQGGPWSMASAFGGTLPAYVGIVVTNNTGAALDSTAGNHAAAYTPVYQTVV